MTWYTVLGASLADQIGYNNPILNLKSLVWCAAAGLLIGMLLSYFARRDAAALIEVLSRQGIDTPEKAITLAEAGLEKNIPLKLALRTGKPLRRLLGCANEDTFPVKKNGPIRRFFTSEAEVVQTDLKTARFYLSEEMKYRAQTRYDTKGISPLHLLISAALLIATAAIVLYAAPKLVDLLDAFLSSLEA